MGRPVPAIQQPQPVTIDVAKSALSVFDGSERGVDPKLACYQLAAVLKPFFDQVRKTGLPIIYSFSARLKGTPEEHV